MDYYVMYYQEKISGLDKREADTAAIQAAIDACTLTGGRVLTQKGRKYQIGTIVLKSNVELVISSDTVLEASGELKDYLPVTEEDGETGQTENWKGRPIYAAIYAKDAENVRISGAGCLDGVSEQYVSERSRYHCTGKFYPRPVMIYVENCRNVSFSDFTIKDAPFWTLHPAGCRNVIIDGIKIQNRLDMANSDGIDPDHCKDVIIRNCDIQSADDCICLKNTIANRRYGSCENILVENCNLISTSAGVKIGTEGIDDFRNVTVKNCRIKKSNRGISIQIRDNGCVEDVNFENIEIETRRFYDGWWGRSEPVYITSIDRCGQIKSGTIKNIFFRNIRCTAENGIFIYGEHKGSISNIFFEDISLRLLLTHKWNAGTYDLRPCREEGLLRRNNSAIFNYQGENVVVCRGTLIMPKDQVPGFGEFIDDEMGNLKLEQVICRRII